MEFWSDVFPILHYQPYSLSFLHSEPLFCQYYPLLKNSEFYRHTILPMIEKILSFQLFLPSAEKYP